VNNQTKQFRIGLIAILIISVHIVLCLYFLFIPKQHRVQNRIVSVYKQLVLLGPFFTESRIKSTRYLSVRYKNQNTWSSVRNLSREHFASYHTNPWRWDKLSYVAYETHLARSVENIAKGRPFEAVKKSAAFRELNGFLIQEFIKTPVDSVEIVGHAATYVPRSRAYLLDTTFVFTYNPKSIGEAKK